MLGGDFQQVSATYGLIGEGDLFGCERGNVAGVVGGFYDDEVTSIRELGCVQ